MLPIEGHHLPVEGHILPIEGRSMTTTNAPGFAPILVRLLLLLLPVIMVLTWPNPAKSELVLV